VDKRAGQRARANKNMKVPIILYSLYNGLGDLFLLFQKSQFWKPNRP